MCVGWACSGLGVPWAGCALGGGVLWCGCALGWVCSGLGVLGLGVFGIERAMRMGSAAAEGCAILSRLVGRPCYRADPEGEVVWWTTRLIEMQTPAEALCMWLSVPLHTEYIENATFAEVTDAVLRDIANLRNARIPVQAACSMACRLGCILPLPLAVAFSFCARASAMDIALTLLANVLHPDLVVLPYPGDPSVRIKPRYWCTPTGDSSAGKSPTMQLVESLFTDIMSGPPDIWPFAKMPGSNMYSDGSHGMFNERERLPLSSSQDAF